MTMHRDLESVRTRVRRRLMEYTPTHDVTHFNGPALADHCTDTHEEQTHRSLSSSQQA